MPVTLVVEYYTHIIDVLRRLYIIIAIWLIFWWCFRFLKGAISCIFWQCSAKSFQFDLYIMYHVLVIRMTLLVCVSVCEKWYNMSVIAINQASVLSVLLYGSECWLISSSLCSRLSAFDMQAQRTITNTKWFEYKTNIEVRTLTNRQPIQRYIAQGRLRWLGHLLRSPPNHPALAIYTFNPRAAGWSIPCGAPRTRWSDVLGKDLKQLGTTSMEASNIALDRSRWRSIIVARAVSTPSWQEP